MLKKIIRWLLYTIGVIGVIGITIWLTGLAMPEKHEISITRTLKAPAEEVWSSISDPKGFLDWRTNLKAVKILSATKWSEINVRGERITYETIAYDPPIVLITQIADKGLPFGGSWTYRLTPKGEFTELTVTENGEVYSPVFRFISKFVFGHDTSIKQYFADLEKQLNYEE